MVNFTRFFTAKIVLFATLLFCGYKSSAQVNTLYNWTASSGTYSPVTLANGEDNPFLGYWDEGSNSDFHLPFDFMYNGVNFAAGTPVTVNPNGWITLASPLGSGIPNYLASASSSNFGVAGFNIDLVTQGFPTFTADLSLGSYTLTNVSSTANLQVGMQVGVSGVPSGAVITNIAGTTVTINQSATSNATAAIVTPGASVFAVTRGTAPNRQVVVQWTGAKRWSGSNNDNISFQIILNEAAGLTQNQSIQVVFGTVNTASTLPTNVFSGLRGSSTTDARSVTGTWSTPANQANNAGTPGFTSSNKPASGQTFTWSPNCPGGAPSLTSLSVSSGAICPTSSLLVTANGPANNPSLYTWTYTGAGGNFTSATTTLLSNNLNLSPASSGTTGTISVVPSGQCGVGTAVTTSISVNTVAPATLSYPPISNPCAPSGTLVPTVTGPSGGNFAATPTGLSMNTTTGAINLSTSQPGTYTIRYNYTNSGCASYASASLTIPYTPVIGVSTNIVSPVCTSASGTLTATAGGAGGYSMNAIPYFSVNPEGPTTNVFNSYADEINAAITLPFSFNFYGNNYTNAWVAANGFVAFTAPPASTWLNLQHIPSTTTPNNMIALAFADLAVDPSFYPTAQIRTFVNGTAPNRIFVIDFIKLKFWGVSNSGNEVTGQILLYETSGVIDVLVNNVDAAGATELKTLGIENAAGTLALSPDAYNYTNWRASSIGYRFSPDLNTYTYSWSPATFLSSTTVRTPTVTNINTTTTYTVTATNTTTGCQGTGSITIEVVNPSTITVSAPSTVTICGPGFANLSATGNGGIIRWYDVASGGTPIYTGANFTTPFINADRDFWVESATASGGCTSTRIKVSVVVGAMMTPLTFAAPNVSKCGSAALQLTVNGGQTLGAPISSLVADFETGLPAAFTASTLVPSISTTLYSQGAQGLRLEYPNSVNDAYYQNTNFDASGANTTTILTFSQIAALEASSSATNNLWDNGFVEYSTDNGSTWTTFPASSYIGGATLSRPGIVAFSRRSYAAWNSINSSAAVPNNAMWQSEMIVLPAAAQVSNLRIRFRIQSDFSVAYYGWMLDDIKLTKYSTTTAPLVWSPTTNLYTNSSTTIPYVNQNTNTVWTNATSNITYIVSTTGGCANSDTIDVSVQNPQILSTTPLFACRGGLYTLSATAAPGQTVRWYSAASGGSPLATGSNYTNTFGSTTTLYVEATEGTCAGTRVPVTITIDNIRYIWLGYNANFNDANNWCGGVPNANSKDVFIPVTPNNPVISGGGPYLMRDIEIAPGATLTDNGSASATLNIFGNIINNGAINFTSPTMVVTLAGTSTVSNNQTLPGPVPITLSVLNISKNSALGRTITVNNNIDILDRIQFTPNVGTNTSVNLGSGDIILRSTAAKTARLAQNTAGVTPFTYGTGRFVVERYIGKHHSWQFLATPLLPSDPGPLKIRETWQENGLSTSGYGAQISATYTDATTRGFDFRSPRANMKTFNSTSLLWDEVPNTNNTNLYNQKGYMLYVRGDRTVNATGAGNTTVLRSRGSINIGNSSSASLLSVTIPAGGWVSIGNPSASPYRYPDILTGGIDVSFVVWDPYQAGSFASGRYLTLSAANSWAPTLYPEGTAASGTTFNSAPLTNNMFLESGQAILQHNSTTSAKTINFTESVKATLPTANRLLFRTGNADDEQTTPDEADAAPDNAKYFRMMIVNATNHQPVDGNAVVFKPGYSKQLDKYDARPMKNETENFFIKRNNTLLAVEARPKLNVKDTIFYNLSEFPSGKYRLRFDPVNFGNINFKGILVDQHLQVRTEVSLTDTTIYEFSFSDENSKRADRFYVIFQTTKPIRDTRFIHINVNEEMNGSEVKWSFAPEESVTFYLVEKSTDGIKWDRTGVVDDLLNSGDTATHSFYDKNEIISDVFYRVKAVDFNKSEVISPVVKLSKAKLPTISNFTLSPNPATGRTITLSANNQAAGNYSFLLLNKEGKILFTKQIVLSNRNQKIQIALPETVVSGLYQAQLNTDSKTVFSEQLILK